MVAGILVAVFLSLAGGAAIDNQFPVVGETITTYPNAAHCDK